jgi:beta-galactosidase
MALAGGNADMVFTLHQEGGGTLKGSLESAGGGGFGGGGFGGGGGAGGPIQDGRVDGANVSFRVGMTTYTGTVSGDRIELQRSGGFGGRGGRGGPGAPAADAGPRPAIGPPPDGTDPSFGAGFGGGRGGGQAPQPLILRRVTR